MAADDEDGGGVGMGSKVKRRQTWAARDGGFYVQVREVRRDQFGELLEVTVQMRTSETLLWPFGAEEFLEKFGLRSE